MPEPVSVCTEETTSTLSAASPGQREPAVGDGRHVQLDVVEPGRDHLTDDVDERRGARAAAGERDRRGRQPALALEQLAQVDGMS